MIPTHPPSIPPHISLKKRVHFQNILNAIGPNGNYRGNIDHKVKDLSASGIGHYLCDMRKMGLIDFDVVPNGKRRSWAPLWRWNK